MIKLHTRKILLTQIDITIKGGVWFCREEQIETITVIFQLAFGQQIHFVQLFSI